MSNKIKAKDEPVALGTLIIAVLVAVGPMLVSFGVDLSAEQLATTQAFALALMPLVAYVMRGKVTPIAKASSAPNVRGADS